jgi:hypothetical protein
MFCKKLGTLFSGVQIIGENVVIVMSIFKFSSPLREKF